MSRAAQQVSLKRQGVVFIQSRLYPFKLLERWEHIEILQLFGKSVLEKKKHYVGASVLYRFNHHAVPHF